MVINILLSAFFVLIIDLALKITLKGKREVVWRVWQGWKYP